MSNKKAILNSNILREIGRLMELYRMYAESEENPELAQAYSSFSEDMSGILIMASNHEKYF